MPKGHRRSRLNLGALLLAAAATTTPVRAAEHAAFNGPEANSTFDQGDLIGDLLTAHASAGPNPRLAALAATSDTQAPGRRKSRTRHGGVNQAFLGDNEAVLGRSQRTSDFPAATPPSAGQPVGPGDAQTYFGGAEAPPPKAPATGPVAMAIMPKALSNARLNRSGRIITIVVALNDDQTYLGDVEIHVLPDDTIEVAALQVLDLLKKVVDPAALQGLEAVAKPGAFATLARFEEARTPLAFNAQSLELKLAIPATARSRQSIGLADLDREQFGDFVAPAGFSAYVNVNSSVDYVHQGDGKGLDTPLVLIDGAMRLKGVVLESEGAWGGAEGGFSRDGTRLVYDDAPRLNRWTAGDLLPLSRGFQGSQELAGIGVERSYSLLDPGRNTAPRGAKSFAIDRPSTVETYINGRSIRRLRLQPGTYDVSDFPFVQGSNDVDLVIVDDAGRRETISFSLFIDRTQLAAGLAEYGLYAGVQSDRQSSRIEYSDDYLVSGFYRRGLTDNITLGANLQQSAGAGVYGLEGVLGTKLGTLGADLAVSHVKNAGTGWAGNASLDRLIQTEGGAMSFAATVEAKSANFGTVGTIAPINPYSVNATLAVNRSFGESSFVGAHVRYAKGRGNQEDERAARLTYGRRLTRDLNLIVDLDYGQGGYTDGSGIGVSITRRFGASSSARAEYDSRDETARLGYQTSGGQGVGAWNGVASLERSPEITSFNGSASYAANRADVGLVHTTAYSQASSKISDQRTSIRAGTSIAFAGGAFAVGRPINDGFVIARPYTGARDVSIEVNPSPEGYFARSGVLGPALYSQVSAYTPQTVTFDAPGAPAGFDIGSGAMRMRPPYKAGYVATIGSEYGVTAIGRLLNEAGEPLTLLSGAAIEQGGEGRRVEVFTNRTGMFGATGLKPGRWRIEMIGDPPVVYQFEIPKTDDGLVRVGDLSPTPSRSAR